MPSMLHRSVSLLGRRPTRMVVNNSDDSTRTRHSAHARPSRGRRLSTSLSAATRAFSAVGVGHKLRLENASDARLYLSRHTRRSLRDTNGVWLRLVAAKAGGDCGFEAISNMYLGRTDAAYIRRQTRQHVSSERFQYKRACGGSRAEVALFCRSITRPGLKGHWLGQMWGALELVAVARALAITLIIHTFDVPTQRLRPYFEEPAGDPVVRLLYTGSAEQGHFDALVPASRWPRRFLPLNLPVA